MKLTGIKMTAFKRIMLLAVLLLLIKGSTFTTGQLATTVQAFCTGNAGGSGAIPSTNILSGKSGGTQNVLYTALLIVLIMLMIVGILYMLSAALSLDLLKSLAKAELGEVIITGIIVLAIIGTFGVLAVSANNGTVFTGAAASTVGFGRNLFVSDCTYLSSASVNLIIPYFGVNTIRWVLGIVTSTSISLEPNGFGFSWSPFGGFSLYDSVLAILDEITGAFIGLNVAALMVLSIIYALFPIFLYAGIILRTLPWSRAAGGAFLGLFIGFYIAFPLLLHVMLASYIPVAVTTVTNTQPPNPSTFVANAFGTTAPTSFAQNFATTLSNYVSNLWVFGQKYGLINGFIYAILEPAVFTFIAIIVAFIISFDVAEAMGDILGAPSLKASDLFKRLI